jgi:hypothetical protein
MIGPPKYKTPSSVEFCVVDGVEVPALSVAVSGLEASVLGVEMAVLVELIGNDGTLGGFGGFGCIIGNDGVALTTWIIVDAGGGGGGSGDDGGAAIVVGAAEVAEPLEEMKLQTPFAQHCHGDTSSAPVLTS